MFVDIGGGTTDISIFHDKQLDILSNSFGRRYCYPDIKEGLGLPRHHAEALKINLVRLICQKACKRIVKLKGEAREKIKKFIDNLYKIIEARMEEIFGKCIKKF